MPPKNPANRGRIILAVAASLIFHGVFALGWFTVRPAPGPGSASSRTEVDGPDDSEFVINLRELPAIAPAEPTASPLPPGPLPDTIVQAPASEVSPVLANDSHGSPPAAPSLPKRPPGKPLHGKLKAGKSIVYVLDRSSSMGTDGLLRAACRSIKDSLSQLNPDSRFQIVAYNSGISTPASEPMAATEANVARASRWLEKLVAEGASDHRAGLREALSYHPDALFLLTDADDLEEREVRAIGALLREPVYLSVAVFGDSRPKGETPLERLMSEVGGSVRYVGR